MATDRKRKPLPKVTQQKDDLDELFVVGTFQYDSGTRTYQPPSATPRPSVATTVGSALGRAVNTLSPLLLLLTPMRPGTQVQDEQPEALYPPGAMPPPPPPIDVGTVDLPLPAPEYEFEALPEIQVTPPRVPPRTLPEVGPDPIMPPNWQDLARIPRGPGYGPSFWYPDFPDFDVTVPRDRPSVDPGSPVGVPGPLAIPGLPFALPIGEPHLTPVWTAPNVRPTPRPVPTPGPSPNPIGEPLPFPQPGPQPGPAPGPDAFPAPGDLTPFPQPDYRPNPIAPPRPGRPAPANPPRINPGDSLDPFRDPDPQPQPQPKNADPCNCAAVKDKKKKPKKDSTRTVCYRGTYRQLSKGIVYNRKEQVPCDPAKKSKPITTRKILNALPF